MNRSISARFVAAAALATAVLGAASAAQAHTDVYFSVGVPARPVYVEPVPVYVQPQPVYVQPRPVHVQPPAYAYERPWRPSYESEFERERAWRRAEWQRRQWEHRHHEWKRRHHEWDRYPSHGRDRD